MKQYGMFTDAGDRKIDELVNSEDFINLSFPEVEKKLETLARLTGPEINPQSMNDGELVYLVNDAVNGKPGDESVGRMYVDHCVEMEREATEDGFETFKPFVEATDTVVCEMVYAVWKARQAWNVAYLRSSPTVVGRHGQQLLDILNGLVAADGWDHLTDDEKVQALLDAAAKINPDVQDVADTLVATINRVKGD